MKRKAIMASMAIMATIGLSAQTKPFTIKGFTNGNEGKYLYLGYGGRNDYKIDSCKVFNGDFSFNGEMKGDVCFGTITSDKNTIEYYTNKQTYVQIEPGNMKVAINVFDPINPIVYGSKHMYQDDELKALTANENAVINAIMKINHESKDEAFKERNEKFMEPFQQAADKKIVQYVKSHPDADNSLQNVTYMMGRCTLEDAKELYASLSQRLQQTEQGKEIAREIANREKIEPGKQAPDFTATDINGKKFTLSKLKGKYVVLDFWASWCGPCRASNPHMKELYDKYGKKGLDFVYVSDDDSNPKKWREAVKKDGLEAFHHVLRGLKMIDRSTYKFDKTNDISEKYAVHYLPTKYLIDKDGKMVGKFNSDELTEKLKEIFGF